MPTPTRCHSSEERLVKLTHTNPSSFLTADYVIRRAVSVSSIGKSIRLVYSSDTIPKYCTDLVSEYSIRYLLCAFFWATECGARATIPSPHSSSIFTSARLRIHNGLRSDQRNTRHSGLNVEHYEIRNISRIHDSRPIVYRRRPRGTTRPRPFPLRQVSTECEKLIASARVFTAVRYLYCRCWAGWCCSCPISRRLVRAVGRHHPP